MNDGEKKCYVEIKIDITTKSVRNKVLCTSKYTNGGKKWFYTGLYSSSVGRVAQSV